MGQAFDRDGQVLGEARGETKREVFDALDKAHKDAHEIRIASGAPPVAEEPMLQWFTFAHLPPALQDASRPFCALAEKIAAEYPRNAERTVALRKLLECKDAAVRSKIAK